MYLRAGAIVLAVAALVLAWNELRNGWKEQYVELLDVPVQLSGVTTHRLSTALTTQYDIAITFRVHGDDPRVMCAIGYLPERYPEEDKHQCAGRHAVLQTTWLLRDAQRMVAKGQTPGEAREFTFGGDGVEAGLGHFASQAGRRQDLTVTFRRDMRFLSFAQPRLVVHANWIAFEGERGVVWTEGAIVLGGIGIMLVLIGAVQGGVRRLRRAR